MPTKLHERSACSCTACCTCSRRTLRRRSGLTMGLTTTARECVSVGQPSFRLRKLLHAALRNLWLGTIHGPRPVVIVIEAMLQAQAVRRRLDDANSHVCWQPSVCKRIAQPRYAARRSPRGRRPICRWPHNRSMRADHRRQDSSKDYLVKRQGSFFCGRTTCTNSV